MIRRFLFTMTMIAVLLTAIVSSSACANNSTVTGNTTKPPLKPKPRVVDVTETTSGSASQYYLTLDIKVKNDGAEGVILVKASVTQAGVTRQNEMDVYIMKGVTHRLKLTFPLVWQGGEFVSNVQAVVP